MKRNATSGMGDVEPLAAADLPPSIGDGEPIEQAQVGGVVQTALTHASVIGREGSVELDDSNLSDSFLFCLKATTGKATMDAAQTFLYAESWAKEMLTKMKVAPAKYTDYEGDNFGRYTFNSGTIFKKQNGKAIIAEAEAKKVEARTLKEAHGPEDPLYAAALKELLAIKARYKKVLGAPFPKPGKEKEQALTYLVDNYPDVFHVLISGMSEATASHSGVNHIIEYISNPETTDPASNLVLFMAGRGTKISALAKRYRKKQGNVFNRVLAVVSEIFGITADNQTAEDGGLLTLLELFGTSWEEVKAGQNVAGRFCLDQIKPTMAEKLNAANVFGEIQERYANALIAFIVSESLELRYLEMLKTFVATDAIYLNGMRSSRGSVKTRRIWNEYKDLVPGTIVRAHTSYPTVAFVRGTIEPTLDAGSLREWASNAALAVGYEASLLELQARVVVQWLRQHPQVTDIVGHSRGAAVAYMAALLLNRETKRRAIRFVALDGAISITPTMDGLEAFALLARNVNQTSFLDATLDPFGAQERATVPMPSAEEELDQPSAEAVESLPAKLLTALGLMDFSTSGPSIAGAFDRLKANTVNLGLGHNAGGKDTVYTKSTAKLIDRVLRQAKMDLKDWSRIATGFKVGKPVRIGTWPPRPPNVRAGAWETDKKQHYPKLQWSKFENTWDFRLTPPSRKKKKQRQKFAEPKYTNRPEEWVTV